MDIETLWKNFRNYVSTTYQATPELFQEMAEWCNDLYRRQQAGENLRLDFVIVQNEINGKTFEAYSLNEQMFISRDSAVLSIPHPRSTSEFSEKLFSDRMVGIYLHDFGYNQEFVDHCKQSAAALPKSKNAESILLTEQHDSVLAYPVSIVRHLEIELQSDQLPGGVANQIKRSQVRYATVDPDGSTPHLDNTLSSKITSWCRVYMHPFLGTGTVYSLDGNDQTATPATQVICPIGATSSHYAMQYDMHAADTKELGYETWGVYHYGQGSASGRSVLCLNHEQHNQEPITNNRSPWIAASNIQSLALN